MWFCEGQSQVISDALCTVIVKNGSAHPWIATAWVCCGVLGQLVSD